MSTDLYNTLYLFKKHDPRMANFAGDDGKERIFFHKPACLGERSYTVDHINRILEEGINNAGLHKMIVWMMEYLQHGYHTGNYPGPAGEYRFAKQEYPPKYIALVEGLSDRAIEIISTMDTSSVSGEIKSDMGRHFCELLLKDREELEQPEEEPVATLVPAQLAM